MKRKAAALSQSLLDVAEAFGSKIPSKRRRLRLARFAKKRSSVNARRGVAKIAKDPFPPEFKTTVTWRGVATSTAPGANTGVLQYQLNYLNDPDGTNVDGNGTPLYLASLFGANGPYLKYRVVGWRAKILLLNTSGNEADGSPIPLEVSICQGEFALTQDDTYAEIVTMPGVQTGLLTTAGSTHAIREFNMNGKLKDYVPKGTDDDEDYCGSTSAAPAKVINLAVGLRNAYGVGSANIKYMHKVEIEFDVIFYSRNGPGSS